MEEYEAYSLVEEVIPYTALVHSSLDQCWHEALLAANDTLGLGWCGPRLTDLQPLGAWVVGPLTCMRL